MRTFHGKPVPLPVCVVFDAFRYEWPTLQALPPEWFHNDFWLETGDADMAKQVDWGMVADIFNEGKVI